MEWNKQVPKNVHADLVHPPNGQLSPVGEIISHSSNIKSEVDLVQEPEFILTATLESFLRNRIYFSKSFVRRSSVTRDPRPLSNLQI